MVRVKKKGEDRPNEAGPLESFPITFHEALQDSILIIGPDRKIISVNRKCCEMFGYSKDALLGESLKVLLSSKDQKVLGQLLQASILGNTSGPKEMIGRRSDMTTFPLVLLVAPVKKGTKVAGHWVQIRHNEDKKRVEAELEETSRFLESVLSIAEEGFVTLDEEGNIVEWSRGAEKIFGLSTKMMIDRPFDGLMEQEADRRRLTKLLTSIYNGASTSSMEFKFTRENGQDIYVYVTGSLKKGQDGEPDGIMMTVKDSTEKKHLEVRLKESEKRLATEVIRKIEDLKYVEQLNRLIVQYMEEGAILLDARLEIGFINPKIIDLLGYSEEEIIGHSIKKIIPDDLYWVWSEIPERSQKGSFRFESPLLKKNGEEIPVMVTASGVRVETRRSEFLCSVIDLTEQKEKEDELREEVLKFKVRRGTVSMVVEKGYHKSADILQTLRRFGHQILIVSRRSNRDMLVQLDKENEDRIFWVEEMGRGTRSIEPTVKGLLGFFTGKVVRATAVLLDRIDYIISKVGFQETLRLLHELVELFYHRKAILIILVDPDTIDEDKLNQLEKDAPILEAKSPLILPEELQEILIYVNQQNRIDVDPSFKDIGKRFKITKTTTRKRIQQLQILELLTESKKGRTKVLRVSEKGLRFVMAQPSRIG